MIDMKRTPRKDNGPASLGVSEDNPYPCGLTISLNEEDLKKLGLLEELPDIDDVCNITAIASVNEVSKTGKSVNVRLQITKLAIDIKPESAAEEKAEETGAVRKITAR